MKICTFVVPPRVWWALFPGPCCDPALPRGVWLQSGSAARGLSAPASNTEWDRPQNHGAVVCGDTILPLSFTVVHSKLGVIHPLKSILVLMIHTRPSNIDSHRTKATQHETHLTQKISSAIIGPEKPIAVVALQDLTFIESKRGVLHVGKTARLGCELQFQCFNQRLVNVCPISVKLKCWFLIHPLFVLFPTIYWLVLQNDPHDQIIQESYPQYHGTIKVSLYLSLLPFAIQQSIPKVKVLHSFWFTATFRSKLNTSNRSKWP